MTSHMISFYDIMLQLYDIIVWYHTWFHSMISYYDITYDIIHDHTVGLSASIVPHIPSFAGFHQSLQRGLEIIMGRSSASLPCMAKNGRLVSWTPSFWITWSLPAVALVSFEPLAALSGKASISAADQRQGAIPLISLATASGGRPPRWA